MKDILLLVLLTIIVGCQSQSEFLCQHHYQPSCEYLYLPKSDMTNDFGNASQADMSKANNCDDISSSLNPDHAFFCKGALGLITPVQRCSALGLIVCFDASLIDISTCSNQAGFGISSSYGYKPQFGTASCNIGSAQDTYIAWGCGGNGPQILIDGPCNGFSKAVNPTGNGWADVNPPGTDGVQTSNPLNGVLCCKP